MNILFLIICAYLIIMTLLGYRRGFIKSVFSLLAVIIAMIITYYCTPYVATFITNNTDIDEGLQQHFVSAMSNAENSEDAAEEKRSAQKETLSELGFPAAIQDLLTDNNNKEFYEALGVNQFIEYIAGYFTGIVVNIISYLCTFALSFLILTILMKTMNWIAELPILHGLNHIGGALFGAAKGAVVLLLFFIVVTLFSNTEFGKILVKMIEANEWLLWIYQNNPILKLVTDITKQIF